MPNWVKFDNLLPKSQLTPQLLELTQSHLATKYKIAFADYHYHILNQLYIPNITIREADTQNWVRAELHSIVMSLYSALDSLFFEINLAYQFGLQSWEIHVHHNHQNFISSCIRCCLNSKNDNLTSLINTELSQPWFEIFRQLRHQIIHKNLPVLQFRIGPSTTRIILPDNPTDSNPSQNGYSNQLEVNQYCRDRRNDILKIVENAYHILESKVKQAYSL